MFWGRVGDGRNYRCGLASAELLPPLCQDSKHTARYFSSMVILTVYAINMEISALQILSFLSSVAFSSRTGEGIWRSGSTLLLLELWRSSMETSEPAGRLLEQLQDNMEEEQTCWKWRRRSLLGFDDRYQTIWQQKGGGWVIRGGYEQAYSVQGSNDLTRTRLGSHQWKCRVCKVDT